MVRQFIRILGASLIIFSFFSSACSQTGPAIVGLQFRPIFKNKFFNSGNTDVLVNGVSFSVKPRLGYSYGMTLRKPLAEKISFEGGINYIRRNYVLGVDDPDSSFSTTANFAIVEYEVPLAALVHIRLGEQFYMNTSTGLSLNMFKRSEVEQTDAVSYSFSRKSWMNLAVIANIGWEYRTEHSGYFYLGSSYQLPFTKVISMSAVYYRQSGREEVDADMNLGFFTVDLKYYLPHRED